jgi:hypothetical protein
VLLLADLFGANWFAYGPRYHTIAAMLGQRASANGWQSFDVIGPLVLVACAAGLAVAYLTASRRSPALPAVITTLLTPVSLALALLVAIRVLLDRPAVHLVQAGGANVIDVRAGAYIGLVLSIAIFIGSYLALRRDRVSDDDAQPVLETLRVEDSRRQSHA